MCVSVSSLFQSLPLSLSVPLCMCVCVCMCLSLCVRARVSCLSVLCVKLLVAPSRSGRSPLHTACASGHTEMARLLLFSGADAELPDRDAVTPFMTACEHGHLAVAKVLSRSLCQAHPRSQGPSLSVSFSVCRSLCLSLSESGCVSAQLLIDWGADPDAAGYDGQSGWLLASAEGHCAVLQWLAELGGHVDVTRRDHRGQVSLPPPPPPLSLSVCARARVCV